MSVGDDGASVHERPEADGHPLEGGQPAAVDRAQEAGSVATIESFLIVFPDGTKIIEAVGDSDGFPNRGDEVSPGWIADEVEIRDGRRDDLSIDDGPVNVEVRVVPRAAFLA